MANFFSTQVTAMQTTPPTRIKVNLLQGRLRFAFGQFTNPASSGVQIADVIYYLRLPRGARVMGFISRLTYSTGAASSTVNVGDSVSAVRYLAATSITTAGQNAISQADTNGSTPYETTDESRDGTGLPSATNDCDIRSVAAGAAMQASQSTALHAIYVQD